MKASRTPADCEHPEVYSDGICRSCATHVEAQQLQIENEQLNRQLETVRSDASIIQEAVFEAAVLLKSERDLTDSFADMLSEVIKNNPQLMNSAPIQALFARYRKSRGLD